MSGLSLTRFYAFHVLVLPALLFLLAATHIFLVRCHGLAEYSEENTHPHAGPGYRFFPEHLFRVALVFAVVLGMILIIVFAVGRHSDFPLQNASSADESHPEWFFLWLFQFLTFFSGRWEWLGSILVPCGGVFILLVLPFLNASPRRRSAARPLALATATTAIVACLYLTFAGWQRIRPYNLFIPSPDRPLTASELRGRQIYAASECTYCHTVRGLAGRPVGPDLSNLAARNRTRQQIVRYVQAPRLVSRSARMPGYDLTPAELNDLASYILALDPLQGPVRLLPQHSLPASNVRFP